MKSPELNFSEVGVCVLSDVDTMFNSVESKIRGLSGVLTGSPTRELFLKEGWNNQSSSGLELGSHELGEKELGKTGLVAKNGVNISGYIREAVPFLPSSHQGVRGRSNLKDKHEYM